MAELNTIVSFVITSKPEAAKAFYGGTLGFELLSDDAYALAFVVGNSMLRVSKMKQFTPESYTVLGWEVGDISAAVRDLAAKGVVFERYPGMPLDENAVCTFPNGDKVAWFKDPDGNVISLSQHKAVSGRDDKASDKRLRR